MSLKKMMREFYGEDVDSDSAEMGECSPCAPEGWAEQDAVELARAALKRRAQRRFMDSRDFQEEVRDYTQKANKKGSV